MKPSSLFSGLTLSLSLAGHVAFGASFQVLGDLPGGNSLSWAYGVSGDGSVVVGVSWSSSGVEAFRWTQAIGMVGLGDLPGGAFNSAANQASFDGSVVLGYGTTTSASQPAFRWTQSGGMVPVAGAAGDNAVLLPNGTVVTGSGFYAEGASSDGSVRVGFNGSQAIRWTQVGGAMNLANLPGTTSSQAAAVSADGSIVVGYFNTGSVHEAFRWTQAGGMVGLGDLPGASYQSEALAVSGDGSVIVGESSGNFGNEAFIWDAVRGMRSLKTVLEESGVDLGGWTLGEAWGISYDGRTIVGAASNSSLGRQEAFVAVIPEPQTSVLLMAGGWLLAGRLRRSKQ